MNRLQKIKREGIKVKDDIEYIVLLLEKIKYKTNEFMERKGINKRVVALIMALTTAVGGKYGYDTVKTRESIVSILQRYSDEELEALNSFYEFEFQEDKIVNDTKARYAEEFNGKEVKIYRENKWGKTRIHIYIDNQEEPVCTMDIGWDGQQAEKSFKEETGYSFDDYKNGIEYKQFERIVGEKRAKKIFDEILDKLKEERKNTSR